MANHNHASGKVLQIFLQHLQRLYVEVVGRLVEYQEVGVAHQHGTEVELALLASAQLVHVVVLFLGREEEELQKLRGGHVSAAAQVDVVGYLCDDVYHLLVFPELQTFL